MFVELYFQFQINIEFIKYYFFGNNVGICRFGIIALCLSKELDDIIMNNI